MNLSPLMGFLNPDNMGRMAEMAVQLSSFAARSMATNEKDVARTVEEPREVPLGMDARPSQILGQAVSDATTQSRISLLKAFAPLEHGVPDPKLIPSTPPPLPKATTLFPDWRSGFPPPEGIRPLNIKPINPIRRSAQNGLLTFSEKTVDPPVPVNDLKSFGDVVDLPRPLIEKPSNTLEDNPLFRLASNFLRDALDFGGIRDYVPGAKENFGIRKGPGCLPFLSEFMQVAYGNCQQVADEKTFDAWGEELKSAILTGQIDLLKASQETCRRGAERQQCGALRRAISSCDILESLQIGAQLQRAMKRCEEMTGLVDQNPMVILQQINSLVGGEFAQGFLNKFLSTGK
ncbi:unnamed protein product [Heligmosomoides polygyrus]|uniref:DUF5610 domain-containing protein n=1 Tax=Heligmosomoides polygyrus TaxID=6339 RepID=A0A3P7YGS5_HELPZ|nr:unnamed protein product [Heligmosomoides polygyrus]